MVPHSSIDYLTDRSSNLVRETGANPTDVHATSTNIQEESSDSGKAGGTEFMDDDVTCLEGNETAGKLF